MTKPELEQSSDSMLKELTKRRASIKGRLTVFKKFVNLFETEDNISSKKRAELKLRLQAAKSLYGDFNDVQNKIEAIITESESQQQLTIRELFEDDYYSVLAQTECMISDDESFNKSMSISNSTFHSVKLPTISLPTFDGNYEQWLEFRDTYLALVHKSSEISDIQKFHYLKSSLKGSAELVIHSLEFSASNYSIAWELLLNRYNNSRLLVHNHVKSLFGIPTVNKESPTLIRKLIDTILKNIRALNLLGEPTEHWDTLIIYLVVSKLDAATEREWEQHKGSLLPSGDCLSKIKLDALIKFLRDKADILDTLSVSHSKSNFPQSSDHRRQTINTQSQARAHCNITTDKSKSKPSQQNTRTRPCIMCDELHSLYSCSRFLSLNTRDRFNFVQDKHLCENCLRSGHTPSDCRYGSCRKCDKKHNSLLHNDETDKVRAEMRSVSLLSANEAPSHSAQFSSQLQAHCVNNGVYEHMHTLHSNSSERPVLLSTATVEIADHTGNYHTIRAILDSGSERSFITQSLCKKLNINTIQSTLQIHGVGNVVTNSTQKCNVKIQSKCGSFSRRISCLVLPHITSNLPTFTVNENTFKLPAHIHLADPLFYERQPIDMLIGADHFWDLIEEGKMRLSNGPYLQNTKLGWIVSGPIYNSQILHSQHTSCNFSSIDAQNIDKQVRMFWELEELPSSRAKSEVTRSEDEQLCEEHFQQTTKRVDDGRFCVRIPFKQPPDTLGESYSQAEKRFLALEKRLERSTAFKQLYKDFIHEYAKLGHMSRITSYDSPHYFMPHHGVLREQSTTTRLRVVFDASAATSNGTSLNDLQLLGEPLQGDLIAILMRFREHKYVACADVEKMYRQVLIDPDQRSLQLILWRDNPSDEIGIFQLNTVTYGTVSAAFLSCKCLKRLAQECTIPDVAHAINNNFYVDDFINSNDSMEKLLFICEKTTETLKSGGFPLRKWVFNFDHGNVLSNGTVKEFSMGEQLGSKTLGLGWHNKSDYLHFHTKFQQHEQYPTKRTILSITSQIFDPLGLLSPTIILAKVLLQRLWLLRVNWDDKVPNDIAQEWSKFVNNLSNLHAINIPRHVFCDKCLHKELHIFTDASQVAYGACAYVRSVDNQSAVLVRLLCSKGKVAPLTPTTIPRLELCGALLGARLYSKIKQSLETNFDTVLFWTDSTIVLGWLHMSPNLLKTYVQNRVSEIHELTNEHQWRHVKGRDNPADQVSRGLHLGALGNSSTWWNGPSFLREPNYDTTCTDTAPSCIALPETKSNVISTLLSNEVIDGSLFPFLRFSQLSRLQRAAAYVLRFIHNLRNKLSRRSGALSPEELSESLLALARFSQQESFPNEYKALNNNIKLHKRHYILKLNVFVDNKKLIRVGGRITNSSFDYDKKHPILLSTKHYFTLLLFRHHHKTLLHAAPQLLLYSLREQWWPIGGRNLARMVVHRCITCARFRAAPVAPLMGNLPPERLQPGFPFIKCGVDYAGPVLIINRRGRGAKTIKSYICLFVCFVTRAIHLELVSDLSSDAYLLALKRFISRRGKPAEIFSDNGKNFVGLKNEFSKFLNSCSENVKAYATSQNIQFHFIPPYASHFGGLWEAGVKSCKHHLRRVIGNAHLTYEELNTVLTQVEAVLNSRPLSPLSTDPDDLQPLSPAHFLIGRTMTSPVHEDLTEKPTHALTRYQRAEQMRQHFWARWSKEYVSELQERIKWKQHTDDLAAHTLVLIKDDNLPPLKWAMGRIIKTFPGNDGISRVADIKTSAGIIRRAFSKICPLPIN